MSCSDINTDELFDYSNITSSETTDDTVKTASSTAIHTHKTKTAPNTLPHLSHYPEWPLLIKEFNALQSQSIAQLITDEPTRYEDFQIHSAGIKLDYSHQAINKEALFLLTQIAERYHLQDRINDLFTGKFVNRSEQKPALHTALRAHTNDIINVNNENINLAIQQTLKRMEEIADEIRNHSWLGLQGLPITDVVNIGMGGSDLGPKMAVHALKEFSTSTIRCHFISDADPDSFTDVVNTLNAASTLFIVASKTFTTKETLLNFNKAKAWLETFSKNNLDFKLDKESTGNSINNQIIAVTAYPERATQCGIQHVLPIWDWVGGRYSFFSAVNLILMIAIGPQHFQQLLTGAREMDTHFRTAPFARNMPVLLALLSIWNLNFFCANNHCLLIYSQRIKYLLPYLQQLEMESNGKSIDNQGNNITYSTSPIVWGGLGNQAEHAFFQLLYEGTHHTPIDCVFINENRLETFNQLASDKLNVLFAGVHTHAQPTIKLHDHSAPGINSLLLNGLTPHTLGALAALYEHKTYCQSVLWNINAFDQPGVEAAKQYREKIM